MSRIALVAAVGANGIIGAQGRIPWRIPEDLRHFKKLTLDKPCIMGRKTWESLPIKPLPGRTNIVITRDVRFAAPAAVVAHSLEEAIVRARSEDTTEIAVIGGAEIYRMTLPRADAIHLTEVHADFDGDARFPVLEPGDWRETARVEHAGREGPGYAFVTLERIRHSV
jgi:dihydrofolate reductase